MIRLLVANGCSYTRGEELPDPKAQAWPVLLARRLGIEVVNLAADGASNRRIVRSTVAELEGLRAARSLRPDEVLTVVAWSQSSRWEYYSERERQALHQDPPDLPVDRHWQRIGSWLERTGHRPSRAFYDHLWSEPGQLTGWFLDWALLDTYLRQFGYHTRYAFAFPIPPTIPEPAAPFARLLPASDTWGGLPPAEGMSFMELARATPRGPGGHPLAEGHEAFAGKLAAWFG